MRKNRRSALLLTTAALALTAVTGCGQERQPGSAADKQQPTVNPKSATPAVPASPPATDKVVSVRSDAELKSVVVDGKGMSLYVFAKDTIPGASSCVDACAAKWPPVPAGDVRAGRGLNQDLLGAITRTDGSKQLTLAGQPLYHHAEDTKPGDANGQGVGNAWYASAPDGWMAGVERPGLRVLNHPKLGKILQDRDGRSLYLFTKDTPWPMKTACDTACLKKWTPNAPVSVTDAESVGIDGTALFSFTTPSGVRQGSFNCWPAYTFNGDRRPGDVNGQNVGGVWFAIKQDITTDRGKTVPAAKG